MSGAALTRNLTQDDFPSLFCLSSPTQRLKCSTISEVWCGFMQSLGRISEEACTVCFSSFNAELMFLPLKAQSGGWQPDEEYP